MPKYVYNVVPDKHDEQDHVFARLALATKMPDTIDLREMFPPAFDQGQLGSCTANAGCGLENYLEKKAGKEYIELSRLFLYYNERVMEGTVTEDAGAQMRSIVKSMTNTGVSEEKYWLYNPANFTLQPPSVAYVSAKNHKSAAYQRVTSLDGIKRSLYEGYPVLIGMHVFESFESDEVAKTGQVPMPKKGEQDLGGHAVLVVGYVDTGKTLFGRKKGYFIVRNSWGPNWGDHGYFYLPYDFMTKYTFDYWTAR